MPFLRASKQSSKATAKSRIWNRIIKFIFDIDTHYTNRWLCWRTWIINFSVLPMLKVDPWIFWPFQSLHDPQKENIGGYLLNMRRSNDPLMMLRCVCKLSSFISCFPLYYLIWKHWKMVHLYLYWHQLSNKYLLNLPIMHWMWHRAEQSWFWL